MDKIKDTQQTQLREPVKLITCVLNNEEDERGLLRALYKERQITRANSVNCRGFASLFEAKAKEFELPEPRFARLIEVIVPAGEADDVFDFIYEKAGLGKRGAGVVFMAPLLGASSFLLPRDIPEED